jgi:four helix bundle protein
MSQIKSFRDLMVWQKAMDLGVGTLEVAKRLPRDEQMSLGHQLRKSAISIPSNIAEGFSRRSTAFYIQHLWTSHASGAELQTQLMLGARARLIAALGP